MKTNSSWTIWATQINSKCELSSCRWSMTSCCELNTMKWNVLLIPHSWFAKRFPAGHWSFLGPGSETQWNSTCNERRQGERDRVAELMMIKFSASGHPVSRATSPLSRGTLKSKGVGKLSFRFCADGVTIETYLHSYFCQSAQYLRRSFRFVWWIQGLSITNGETCCGRAIWSTFRASRLIDSDPQTDCRLRFLHEKIYCKNLKNKWKNKIDWSRFVLMKDSCKQLKSDSSSWQSTLTSLYKLQRQWDVVSIFYDEMKKHLNRKVGSEGTPKLGSFWKSQPLNLWVQTIDSTLAISKMRIVLK